MGKLQYYCSIIWGNCGLVLKIGAYYCSIIWGNCGLVLKIGAKNRCLNSRAPMDNSTVCIEGITLAK